MNKTFLAIVAFALTTIGVYAVIDTPPALVAPPVVTVTPAAPVTHEVPEAPVTTVTTTTAVANPSVSPAPAVVPSVEEQNAHLCTDPPAPLVDHPGAAHHAKPVAKKHVEHHHRHVHHHGHKHHHSGRAAARGEAPVNIAPQVLCNPGK